MVKVLNQLMTMVVAILSLDYSSIRKMPLKKLILILDAWMEVLLSTIGFYSHSNIQRKLPVSILLLFKAMIVISSNLTISSEKVS